jgi:hypothetical protein
VIGRDTSTGQMWSYDAETDTWLQLDQGGSVPPPGGSSGFQLLGYDRSAERAILTTERRTWQLDPASGVWERAGLAGPVRFFIGGREIAYDAARERILVYGAGAVTAYDARSHDWQVLADDPYWWPGDRLEDLGAGYAMAYDPLNDRLVVVGGGRPDEAEGWAATDGVIAFDLETLEWVELLAPSEG